MRSKRWLVVVLVLTCIVSHAQEVLRVEQAIELALSKNFDVLLAKNDAEIARRNNTAGNAGMLPRVSGNLSDNFTLNNLNQQLANGTEINSNNVQGNALSAGVTLNWTLFDGMRMFAAKSRLSRLEEIGELQMKDEMQRVVAEVMNAYYNVVRIQQQTKAITESIKVSEERVKLAELRFSVGTTGKSEMLQAKVDLNEQRSNLLTQQRLLDQARADVNVLLARDADQPFLVTDSIPLLKPALDADAEQRNLQLLVAMKNVEISKQTKREVFSQFLPTLNGNVGYNYNLSNNSAGFFLSNQTNGLNAGFTLSVSLFNGLNTIRQHKVAALQQQSASFQVERVRFALKQGLYKAQRAYLQALEQLKLEQENIALAAENQQIALERFRLSQSTAIELREAQFSLVNAETRLLNASYDAKLAEVELMRLRSELVK